MAQERDSESGERQESSFSVPHHLWVQKVQMNSIIAVKVQKSPPSIIVPDLITQTTLTDKISFAGPCPLPKIFEQKGKRNPQGDSFQATNKQAYLNL